jgi:hypothetical protein
MSKNNIDKLIEIAQEVNKDADKVVGVASEGLNEAQKFIIALNIKKGRSKNPIRTIYEAYKNWAPEPISKSHFCQQFALYFQPERKNSYRFYKLNLSPWEIDCKIREMKEKIYGK